MLIMGYFNVVLGIFLGFLKSSNCANIFVSHYSGTVNTLTFSPATNSLTLNSSLRIGGQPSWLHWDLASRTLYAPDETSFGSGSLTAVSAANDGKLSQIGKSTAPLGAVACVLYGGGYIAIAHYQISTISTFKLPLSSSPSVLQTFSLKMSGPGTIPSRQDAPHPHQTFVDPTGAFILVPDLGADLIRIYAIGTGGELTACGSYVEVGGTGPRHGAFSGDGKILYIANELANTVHAFTFAYTNGCMSLTRFQTLTTFPNNSTAPKGSKVGEIHIKDNFLYVSNRRDLSFSPNDSIASFSLDSAGKMTFIDITSSGGHTHAHLIGKLGPQLASLRVGTTGTAESDNGLSAVLFDQ
ncbi:Lactonase, 7-bladed beta-propeller-domain-containing protein [Bisporella sp. PMI_857]|nr:Lactonase, 7-bladed beta-propeller-domain-containing protein [Bisporella sp. PMI_857]